MPNVTIGCKLPHGLLLELDGTAVTAAGANTSTVVNGHGLTELDQAFWDEWLKRNQGLECVRNNMIFAHQKPQSAKAQARDNASNPSGLEPVDPAKDKTVEKAER